MMAILGMVKTPPHLTAALAARQLRSSFNVLSPAGTLNGHFDLRGRRFYFTSGRAASWRLRTH